MQIFVNIFDSFKMKCEWNIERFSTNNSINIKVRIWLINLQRLNVQKNVNSPRLIKHIILYNVLRVSTLAKYIDMCIYKIKARQNSSSS